MGNIIEVLEKNKFSYNEIKQKSFISLVDKREYDINVIIGFRGRHEFLKPVINSFNKAFNYFNFNQKLDGQKTFALTFVEHSDKPEAQELLEYKYNYIWTPGNVTDQYSRSFAYNFGVKYSNKAKYYILHDIDILVKDNFFEEVFKNLGDNKCMQTYGGRRVLYLSKDLTDKVLMSEVDINILNEKSENVSLPMYNGQPALGSKGGSILVEREFFYEIGGFSPELFWGYAAEDQEFWEKAMTVLGEVCYADNPPIDIFHMWHPPSSGSNPLLYEMENYFIQFRNMKKKDRMNFLTLKKELFKDE